MGAHGRSMDLGHWFCGLPDVDVSYICDVDPTVGGPLIQLVADARGKRLPRTPDIRTVLDDKSVDAIVIATEVHWHAPGTILACEAGKDVYVEKAASIAIREGQLMVESARRNRRVVQLGIQARSRPVTQRFIDYVHSGKIGRVLMAKVWNAQMRRSIGHKIDEPVPPGLDYDTWTGPLPMLPFNRNHFHGTVNCHWHYGGGDLLHDSVHWMDIARWALGVEYPLQVSGMGAKICFDDDQQTPDTMNITYNFAEKVLFYEHRIWNPYRLEGSENGVAIYGTDGMAVLGRWVGSQFAFRVFDAKGNMVYTEQESKADDNYHARNFIDCVRSREKPTADIEIGEISTVLCHLGNIVARTGRAIRFEPATRTILDDPDANRLVSRVYRKHWSTPKGAEIA